jgi:hypothetical protein
MPLWSANVGDAGRAGALCFAVTRDAASATYADVIDAWRDDADFRAWWNALLADVTFSAFRWETPPVTQDTASRPFECALLDSPGLARAPDPDAFAEHFADASAAVLSFANLGNDAMLVVPRPIASASAYGHIAAFVRRAPDAQKHALWQAVAEAMTKRLGAKPVWLSTAGDGVSWLHVRLDDRPKYYEFAPYRNPIGIRDTHVMST